MNIDPNRVQVIDVTEGSTIFLLEIADEPDSRAEDICVEFERKVLANEWNMDTFTILAISWENSEEGTINTRENEPTVSQASIIGVFVGIGVVALWAVFWRRFLLQIAKRCCIGEEDDEVEGQEALMQVQSSSRGVFDTPKDYAKLTQDKPVKGPATLSLPDKDGLTVTDS